MTVLDLAESLGVLDPAIRSDLDLLEAVTRGLPVDAVDAVVHSGMLTADEADRLIIPRDVLEERRGSGGALTPEESDRLVRVVRITIIAIEQFGDPAKASGWLRTTYGALDGKVPLDLLATGEGARMVEETIMRIAHGIFF